MHNNQFPFIGRHEAFDVFHSLPSARAQKNVLYVQASGGLGKTRLLREYIQSCYLTPRWHVRPHDSEIDPLIDFFELRNRSVSGLRRSIIERLGWEYFTEFHSIESELRSEEAKLNAEGTNGGNEHLAKVVALRRRRDGLFFRNLRPALRGRQVILFFDTFELVSHRQVGRWLLREFLPQSEACLIVIAGRPPCPALPPNIRFMELGPFTEDETMEYFRKRNWLDVSTAEVRDLRNSAEGSPLLLDMLMDFRNAGLLELSKLRTASKQTTEQALVDRLIRVQKPEHTAIVEMAYLKRRYDPNINAHRQQGQYPAYEGLNDFNDLCIRLLDSELRSIVKFRQDGQILTLHDEVQRMIEEHAPSCDRMLWQDSSEELFLDVVRGWYPAAIDQAGKQDEQNLLKAEQLGYELERDTDSGLDFYQGYFEQARHSHGLDFNELIWDEIENQIRKGALAGHEYSLIYEQAEWLWAINEFDMAALLYDLIITSFTTESQQSVLKLDALAAQGHAFMALGRFEQAFKCFEDGLGLAATIASETWSSAFLQNRGQLLQATHKWDEAEDSFKQAVQRAQVSHAKEPLALACLYLGRLGALLGRYDEAILNCEKAVALRLEILKNPEEERMLQREEMRPYYEPPPIPFGYYSIEGVKTRVASAYLWLAESYRYAREREYALSCYSKAETYLSVGTNFDLRCDIEQGKGNIFHDKGLTALTGNSCSEAIGYFLKAFTHLQNALTMCRQYLLDREVPKALHRMAHVFFGVSQLEHICEDNAQPDLRQLKGMMASFLLPEEDPWRENVGRLRENASFFDLTTVGKAQRLFEVSSLEAESLQDYNTYLDSLIQACEIALYRGRSRDALAYSGLAQVPSQAYQQELFLALTELVLADLDLAEDRIDQALERYGRSFPILATGGGFGRYLLEDHLDQLDRRMMEMSSSEATAWCDDLIQQWTRQGLDASNPELVRKLWKIRNRIVDS